MLSRRKHCSRLVLILAWFTYTAIVLAIGLPLAYALGEANWNGPLLAQMNLLTWGNEAATFVGMLMGSIALTWLTGGVGGGVWQDDAALVVTLALIASIQFFLVYGLVRIGVKLIRTAKHGHLVRRK
jgi:hypothetical protein